jgi:hypothetical protein
MPEPLLHRFHDLPDGRRVRLRLPLARDRAALHELLGRLGLAADELDVGRALRWAPNRRVAVLATTWADDGERVVGFAAVDTAGGGPTVLGDPAVTGLLCDALADHASAWSRRVA